MSRSLKLSQGEVRELRVGVDCRINRNEQDAARAAPPPATSNAPVAVSGPRIHPECANARRACRWGQGAMGGFRSRRSMPATNKNLGLRDNGRTILILEFVKSRARLSGSHLSHLLYDQKATQPGTRLEPRLRVNLQKGTILTRADGPPPPRLAGNLSLMRDRRRARIGRPSLFPGAAGPGRLFRIAPDVVTPPLPLLCSTMNATMLSVANLRLARVLKIWLEAGNDGPHAVRPLQSDLPSHVGGRRPALIWRGDQLLDYDVAQLCLYTSQHPLASPPT